MRTTTLTAILVMAAPALAVAQDAALAYESVIQSTTVRGRLMQVRVELVVESRSRALEEARFDIAIPESAAVTRLAMSVSGELQEGRIVDRERGRAVFEEITMSRRDPALLEWQGPGDYRLEVFPILPGERKTVLIEYAHLAETTTALHELRLTPPVPRSPNLSATIGTVRLEIDDRNAGHATRIEHSDAPTSEPLVTSVDLPQGAAIYVDRKFPTAVIADLPPNGTHASALGWNRGLVVAIDTSASGGQARVDRAAGIGRALAAQTNVAVRVVHGSMRAEACRTAWRECLARLESRGATNLEALLTEARRVAEEIPHPTDIVLLSDGKPTMGERGLDALAAIVGSADRDISLHAVGRDETLDELAAQGRGHAVPDVGDVAAVLGRIEWARNWPRTNEIGVVAPFRPWRRWVGPNDRVVVDGYVRSGRRFVVRAFDYEHVVRLGRSAERIVAGPVVRQLIARREIRRLEQRGAPGDEILRASVAAGVLSRATSLLALESDAMWREHRGTLRGKGGSRPASTPAIRMSSVVVMGSLDKEIIKRVIRQYRREVRHCYETALTRDGALAGRVVVAVEVGADGRVLGVRLDENETGDAPLADCVVDSARGWRFPWADGRGFVTIHYPFEFRPEGEGSDVRRHEPYATEAERTADPDGFVAAARERLRKEPRGALGLRGRMLAVLLESATVADVIALGTPREATLRFWLSRLARLRNAADAHAIGRSWIAEVAPAIVYDALVGDPHLERLFAVELVAAVLAIGSRTPAMIETLLRIQPAPQQEAEVRRVVTAHHRNRIGVLEIARVARPGDVDILTELATLLNTLGRPDDAREVLSEIVEFRGTEPDAEALLDRATRKVFGGAP